MCHIMMMNDIDNDGDDDDDTGDQRAGDVGVYLKHGLLANINYIGIICAKVGLSVVIVVVLRGIHDVACESLAISARAGHNYCRKISLAGFSYAEIYSTNPIYVYTILNTVFIGPWVTSIEVIDTGRAITTNMQFHTDVQSMQVLVLGGPQPIDSKPGRSVSRKAPKVNTNIKLCVLSCFINYNYQYINWSGIFSYLEPTTVYITRKIRIRKDEIFQ